MGQSRSLQSADAEAGAVQGFCGFAESLCSLVSSRVEEFTSKHGTVLPTSSPLEKSSIGQAPIPEDASSSAGSVVSTVISSATTSVVNPASPSSFKKTQPQVPSTHPTSLDAVTVDVSITDTVTSASAAASETSQLMDTTPTDGGKSTPTTGTMTVTAASSVSLDTDTTTLDILPSPSDSLIAGSSNPSPRNASAIAGGVIGGVVLIVLCALSLMFRKSLAMRLQALRGKNSAPSSEFLYPLPQVFVAAGSTLPTPFLPYQQHNPAISMDNILKQPSTGVSDDAQSPLLNFGTYTRPVEKTDAVKSERQSTHAQMYPRPPVADSESLHSNDTTVC